MPPARLDSKASRKLSEYQATVDAAGNYGARVAAAKRAWTARNTSRNATFSAVRAALTKMCSGARRCNYCEDSVADEVEHIRPKNLYPDRVFAWMNYAYACGPCNGPKNNGFAVFTVDTGTIVDVSRTKGAPIAEPAAGDPVLIDPRSEDPLSYLFLDIEDTFYFAPAHPQGTREWQRADYTIRLLRLNDREYLVAARREAYASYRARLREYRAQRDQGVDASHLKRLREGLVTMGHPTVWAEMKRQREHVNELREAFRAVPDAVDW